MPARFWPAPTESLAIVAPERGAVLNKHAQSAKVVKV